MARRERDADAVGGDPLNGASREHVRATVARLGDRVMLYLGAPLAVVYCGPQIVSGEMSPLAAANALLAAAGVALTTWGRRLPPARRGGGYALLLLLFATVALFQFGPLIGVGAFFIMAAVGVAVFGGIRGSALAVAAVAGVITAAALDDRRGLTTVEWVEGGLATLAAMAVTSAFVAYLLERMEAAHRAALRALERERAERAAHEDAQRELARVRRIEAIARLAGGVAHEVNNALMVMLGNVELMRTRGLGGEEARALLDDVLAAGHAARDTVQTLASLDGPPLAGGLASAGDTVHSVVAALTDEAPAGVTLVAALTADGDVPMGPDVLERVLGVLIRNAWEAMPGGGQVDVVVSADGGERIGVAVRDRGTGMSPEVLEHVFEPFFTTKPEGAGGGLGLAWVFGVVHRAGGEVDVQSQVGEGSTLTVWLPRV
ncbi:MAG: hypothetical protein CVU56_17815 [Deltaproteobacteria bacterium HGW-Deltaproteobacteria-14]|jgi:signal transduction histidine kinase|nr:MAG: hypothetical protein CVU56_17815 [Deltaproteobacteria bacterium HGW-Deltaproteobacteria-14]